MLQLGLRPPRRPRPRRVDRRDEARRDAHRAHPVPRGRAQPATPRQRARRPDRARAAGPRPRRGEGGGGPPQPGHRRLRGRRRQRLRELLERILVAEEEHADWLETQLSIIESVGVENYLSQQLHDDE